MVNMASFCHRRPFVHSTSAFFGLSRLLVAAVLCCCYCFMCLPAAHAAHDLLAVKAGAALAALGAGAASQLGPAVLAATMWAPPQHHDNSGHHSGGGSHHNHYQHQHHNHHHDHQHSGGDSSVHSLLENGIVGHGHKHGYDDFGFAHLPAPVVNMGRMLRLVALPPLHDFMPRVNIALPRVYPLHDHHSHNDHHHHHQSHHDEHYHHGYDHSY